MSDGCESSEKRVSHLYGENVIADAASYYNASILLYRVAATASSADGRREGATSLRQTVCAK